MNLGLSLLFTLMTLLKILFFGRIGSTKLVLPKWQNIDILKRDNRVGTSTNFPFICCISELEVGQHLSKSNAKMD